MLTNILELKELIVALDFFIPHIIQCLSSVGSLHFGME